LGVFRTIHRGVGMPQQIHVPNAVVRVHGNANGAPLCLAQDEICASHI